MLSVPTLLAVEIRTLAPKSGEPKESKVHNSTPCLEHEEVRRESELSLGSSSLVREEASFHIHFRYPLHLWREKARRMECQWCGITITVFTKSKSTTNHRSS